MGYICQVGSNAAFSQSDPTLEASLKTSARSLFVRMVVLPVALFGCGTDKPTAPRTGDVVVGVSGLPAGSHNSAVVP